MQTTGHTFKITPSVKREIVKIVDERVRRSSCNEGRLF